VKPLVRRAPISVVFSEPGIAMVGTRYADLAADSFVTGEVSFEDQGRSRVMLRNRGLMHVYVDKATRRFAGAEWIGPDAEHIAHLLSWALQMHLTVDAMLAMPFYHPVVEEGLRTALRHAAAQLQKDEE
jgi:dihydrolipoamide dehydrogenase